MLQDIEKKFNIELFYGTGVGNANDWIIQFEKECKRHRVFEDDDKIEALRLLTRKGARDWFILTSKREEHEKWEEWKEAFKNQFDKRNYNSARSAVLFHYQAGSLREYVYKKQRLLIDEAPECDEEMLIILIVVGLPYHIQRTLNRKKIEKVDDLLDKLVKHEPSPNPFGNRNEVTGSDSKFNKPTSKPFGQRNAGNKIECKFCTSKGFPGRRHREEDCFWKDPSKRQQKQANLYQDEDQKKRGLRG